MRGTFSWYRLNAEIDDYARQDEDDDEDDDEEVIKQILQREKDILASVSSEKQLEKVNLNKLNDREVTVVKKMMDQKFIKNKIRPGDPGFQYDIEKEFDPEESNEWDRSQSSQNLKLHLKSKPAGNNTLQVHQKNGVPDKPQIETKPVQMHHSINSKNIAMGDEEFDIDFDEDFNDDLDDFED